MRTFTEEEKELIANTPITLDVFDMTDFCDVTASVKGDNDKVMLLSFYWEGTVNFFDILRMKYLKTKDEKYFRELVRLLPASYKVVKL